MKLGTLLMRELVAKKEWDFAAAVALAVREEQEEEKRKRLAHLLKQSDPTSQRKQV